MGSFWGHVDEASFFLVLAYWWMFKIFSRYLESVRQGRQYEAQGASFPTKICRRVVPLESILKMSFCIFGATVEFLDGFVSLDKDNNFKGLAKVQHVSIYTLFILHSIVDILTYYDRFKSLPKNLGVATLSLAVFWYGVSFFFHANMKGKLPLEYIIHLLPVFNLIALSISLVLEMYVKASFILSCARIHFLMILGTWFIHTPFVLYDVHSKFPASDDNKYWARDDHRNVDFMIAMYGYHLALNFTIMLITYLLMDCWFKRRSNRNNRNKSDMQTLLNTSENGTVYEPLNNIDEDL
ncbi:DgyrCDS3333 [Dimorphilus gyrociliatus]|uniref:DgyrCDS3333 n=1 Tax=Dimorphilus gyrociliatus TaxID=2664684 RepID=A0A7I8VFL4_9ANNE|nr:DgyrCDS3333 [Dimorphilus gyrociliatus]